MATVRPFAAVRYADRAAASGLIAPPYDVLDEPAKRALLARNPRNVVEIDLPHTPPKTLGPDAAYDRAGDTYRRWLGDGTLARDARPALYPYTQSYDLAGRRYDRRGFIGLVRLTPFGQDVIPHERTHAGPIDDRLRLMRAARAQLSPIFGLFGDPGGHVTDALHRDAGAPEVDADLDGVRHRLWACDDPATIADVAGRLADGKLYVADGHHRYTTALHHQRQAIEANGGTLPDDHPANFCMFVLVAMQDPGLTILGYHRLIGGLNDDDLDAIGEILADGYELKEVSLRPDDPALLERPGTVGLYHGRTGSTFRLDLTNPDVLAALAPERSAAWRRLDSAIVQRFVIDEALRVRLNGGQPSLTVGYTADAAAVPSIVDGGDYQLALLLRPTPLTALAELGRTGEVMPPKSTFFAPKVATGLTIHPLD